MRTMAFLAVMGAAIFAAGGQEPAARPFSDAFAVDEKDLVSTGRNPYFILEPGFQLVLENPKMKEVLTVTVLEQTRTVGGIETRVVEERETVDGNLVEVSRNYFAICKRSNSVYYFGEEVDQYKGGEIVGHEGAWLHGEKGARFGLMMAGLPILGARYYQEIAPEVAMDRAEIVEVNGTYETPAGKFERVLKTEETTPLNPAERSRKRYAPGIGMIKDGKLKLVRYGTKK